MNPTDYIEEYLARSRKMLELVPIKEVRGLIRHLEEARRNDRQIFLCGNGGSASTASHLATELGKMASQGRKRRFRVVSLAENMAWITALANDLNYSKIFVEQLKNFARTGDLLIAFSGSGNSANVIEAVEWANQNGLLSVGITGRPGGRLGERARFPIFVEACHQGQIEEGHFLIQHLISYYFIESDERANE